MTQHRFLFNWSTQFSFQELLFCVTGLSVCHRSFSSFKAEKSPSSFCSSNLILVTAAFKLRFQSDLLNSGKKPKAMLVQSERPSVVTIAPVVHLSRVCLGCYGSTGPSSPPLPKVSQIRAKNRYLLLLLLPTTCWRCASSTRRGVDVINCCWANRDKFRMDEDCIERVSLSFFLTLLGNTTDVISLCFAPFQSAILLCRMRRENLERLE